LASDLGTKLAAQLKLLTEVGIDPALSSYFFAADRHHGVDDHVSASDVPQVIGGD
jgi:hypothetical protein